MFQLPAGDRRNSIVHNAIIPWRTEHRGLVVKVRFAVPAIRGKEPFLSDENGGNPRPFQATMRCMKTKTNFHLFTYSLRMAGGVLIALLASSLFAQTSDTVKSSDRSFLKKAAKAGAEEISISTIAAERSQNPQVKEYAQMIVSDHKDINSDLSSLASAKGVELPAKQPDSDKWAKKSAEDFDKDYIKQMIDDHEDAVELFSKGAQSDDSQIASFASKQLPVLQTHLSKAKDILKEFQ